MSVISEQSEESQQQREKEKPSLLELLKRAPTTSIRINYGNIKYYIILYNI